MPLEILVHVQALSQLAANGRPMGRRKIGPASSVLGEGLASRDVLVPSRSSDSKGGPGACTLTRSPGVQCFLQHISAAGFWVKWALCQEAVQLGWIVFRRTQGSRPSPLPSPYKSCSNETKLTTNWGEKEVNGFFFM